MKKIAILGSTGSIGTQSLEVIRSQPDMEATVLAAGSNVELLEKQIREFHPKLVCVYKEDAAKVLKQAVADLDVTIVSGMDGLIEAAAFPETQIVVTAVVGMIGIRPTIAAIKAGKDIALANKETLDALVKPIEQELKFVSAATGVTTSFKSCLIGKYQDNKMFEDDTLKFGEIELR